VSHDYSSIGKRLKEIRKLSDLTQLDFSKKIGVNRSHISKIERNLSRPSRQFIKSVCIAFGINEEWLLNGVGIPLSKEEFPEWIGGQYYHDKVLSSKIREYFQIYIKAVENIRKGIDNATDELKGSNLLFLYDEALLDEKERLLKELKNLNRSIKNLFERGKPDE